MTAPPVGALVTAEFTAAAERALTTAGVVVRRAGWGVDGRVLDTAALVRAAAGAAVLLVELERVDAEVCAALPQLRLVGTARGTPTNVDVAACRDRGIPVVHTPGRNADSVADFTIGAMLAAARGLSAGERQLREHGWLVGGELPYLHFRGPELTGRTLGLVGFGAVGRAVARRAVGGFGMKLLVCDPAVSDVATVDLATLLVSSDVVSLHCPLTPATTNLIGAAELALLRPGAVLVNTARGGVLDEAALVAALRAGRLAGAALDVYADEPLPATSPLLTAPRLVCTPHLAGASTDVVAHHSGMLVAAVRAWRDGAALPYLAAGSAE